MRLDRVAQLPSPMPSLCRARSLVCYSAGVHAELNAMFHRDQKSGVVRFPIFLSLAGPRVHTIFVFLMIFHPCLKIGLTAYKSGKPCFPIQYALTQPDRIDTGLKRLDLAQAGCLTFERVNESVFPSLSFAREAMRQRGTMAAVMNAANDVAGLRFRDGEIALPSIWTIIEKTMAAHENRKEPTLDEIFAADEWARSYAAALQVK